MFYVEMNALQASIPLMEKLVRIIKEINGTEDNQKILQINNQLSQAYMFVGKFTEALLLTENCISIYKNLNGAKVEDATLGEYLFKLALI